MSLINQALHKAQRDRTPKRMPQPGEQSPAAYANSAASGMNPALVIGLVIAVAVLIGLVVGLSDVIFNDGSKAPQQFANAPASLAPATSATPQISQPLATTGKFEAAPEPSVVDELRKAREAAEAKAAYQTKAAEQAAARAAAKPSEDIIAWLGSAKLSGVRISGTGNKAIVNGNTYSVGDFVNFKLGLKVMIIQQTRVFFVDNNGKK
jgi:hypothetical protein